MLDLAISTDDGPNRTTIIETNRGKMLEVMNWPQDCEFQLVAFTPAARTAQVVFAEALATDIAHALKALSESAAIHGQTPDWYRRLSSYADGAGASS